MSPLFFAAGIQEKVDTLNETLKLSKVSTVGEDVAVYF